MATGKLQGRPIATGWRPAAGSQPASWPLRRFRARGDSREWHQGQGKYADYRFYSDVSVDNSNAVLYGYAIYYDLAADVDRLMTHLLDNHYRIVDLDGEVTQYGHVGIDPDRRATAPLCSMPKPTAARR